MNPINYPAWINLFALSIGLMANFPVNEKFSLVTYWDKPDSIHYSSNEDNMVLFVDFYSLSTGQKIAGFVFIPWQDLYPVAPQLNDPFSIKLEVKLITVTPFCLVFELPITNKEEDDSILVDSIKDYLADLCDFESNQMILEEGSELTIAGDLQIINIIRYRWYTDLQVAAPGSGMSDPKSIEATFPDNMIHSSIIPDMGDIRIQWLKSGQAGINPFILQHQDYLIALFEESINKCTSNLRIENRKVVFESTLPKAGKFLEDNKQKNAEFLAFTRKMLGKFLWLNHTALKTFIPKGPFPDYQPKTTPDETLDFRPSLAKDLDKLPDTNLENLGSLIGLFENYKKLSQDNPGEWIDGNMLLGAMEKEYQPGDEELILAEIGNRIRSIIDTYDQGDIKNEIEKQNITYKSFEYKYFGFIHYDVMGSGRFFYINEINDIEFKLP